MNKTIAVMVTLALGLSLLLINSLCAAQEPEYHKVKPSTKTLDDNIMTSLSISAINEGASSQEPRVYDHIGTRPFADGIDYQENMTALLPTRVAPQLWYLDSELTPAGREMEKSKGPGDDGQAGSVSISSGGNVTWLADQAALGDVNFSSGVWAAELRTDSDWGSGGDKCGVSVGGWDTGTGWYEIPTIEVAKTVNCDDSGCNILIFLHQTSPGIIYKDDYLAIMIKNNDSISHTVFTNGRSSLRSPDADPGYPISEPSVEPDIDVTPKVIGFGTVVLGMSSNTKKITVSNIGGGPLNIGNLTINNNQFSIYSGNISGKTLIPDTSDNIVLTFIPAASGLNSGTLTIPSNDPDENPVIVNLSGTGYFWYDHPIYPEEPEVPEVEETEQEVETYFVVDFLNKISAELASADGRPLKRIAASSPDRMHLLEIEEGTRAIDEKGNMVTRIEIREASVPSLPENTALIGKVYEFNPSGTGFDKPIRLTLGYDVNKLPKHVTSIDMAYFVEGTGWTYLQSESSVLAELGKVVAPVKHFTKFAILAGITIPSPPLQIPASFTLGNLSITSSVTKIWKMIPFMSRTGKEAGVAIDVTNEGGQRGSYDVTLMLNGIIQETKNISLEPGQTQTVSFTVRDNDLGSYKVQIGDLTEKFSSELSLNWWLILGAGAVLIIIFWLLISQFKRKEK